MRCDLARALACFHSVRIELETTRVAHRRLNECPVDAVCRDRRVARDGDIAAIFSVEREGELVLLVQEIRNDFIWKRLLQPQAIPLGGSCPQARLDGIGRSLPTPAQLIEGMLLARLLGVDHEVPHHRDRLEHTRLPAPVRPHEHREGLERGLEVAERLVAPDVQPREHRASR